MSSPVPAENTVRPAIFELTMISLYRSSYDIHPFPYVILRAEVPPGINPGEPRTPSSTRCPPKERETTPLDEPRPNPVGHRDTAPKHLIRDRDEKYGEEFVRRVESLGIKHVLISARSPWQNPYVERVVGSIRRSSPHAVPPCAAVCPPIPSTPVFVRRQRPSPQNSRACRISRGVFQAMGGE